MGEVIRFNPKSERERAHWSRSPREIRQHLPAADPAREQRDKTPVSHAVCAKCAGAMTLRTGKNTPTGYCSCSTKARQGETGCIGRSVPMDKLDNLVAGHIEHRPLDIAGQGGVYRPSEHWSGREVPSTVSAAIP